MRSAFRIYDYRILLGSLTMWGVLLLLPNGFIKDYLNLEKVIETGVMTRIILSFTSFFGFLITILILTYGLLREKFRRLTLNEFLENKYSIFLISSFVCVFLINIFSAIYINSREVSHVSLNLSYYSLFLSILYFFTFLPIAFISISYTDSQSLIEKHLKKLDINQISEYRAHELTTTLDERNPFTVLMNLARFFTEKDDFHSVTVIIFSTQKRIEELIDSSRNREEIGRYLSGQKLIWEAIVHKAFQKKDYDVINNIFLANSLYHYYFSKKEIPLLFLEEIKYFIEGVAERLVQENLTENVEQVNIYFERILEFHYNHSLPPEDEIRDIVRFKNKYSKKKELPKSSSSYNIDVSLQWQNVYSDIPHIFSTILSQAIESKSLIIFERSLDSVQQLISTAYNSSLGEFQKAWVIKLLVGKLYYFQIEAIKKGLIKDSISLKAFNHFLQDTIVEEDFFYKKELLVSSSEFLLDLFKIGKLDLRNPHLNFLGGLGRHCSNNFIESETYRETLYYIIKVINHLKLMFEKSLSENSINYKELKLDIESFIQFHKEPIQRKWNFPTSDQKNEVDSKLICKLQSLLSEFKEIQESETNNRIEWE